MITEVGNTSVEGFDLVGDTEKGDDGGQGGGDELAVGGDLLIGHVQHCRQPRHLPRGHPPHRLVLEALASAAARHQFFLLFSSFFFPKGDGGSRVFVRRRKRRMSA